METRGILGSLRGNKRWRSNKEENDHGGKKKERKKERQQKCLLLERRREKGRLMVEQRESSKKQAEGSTFDFGGRLNTSTNGIVWRQNRFCFIKPDFNR